MRRCCCNTWWIGGVSIVLLVAAAVGFGASWIAAANQDGAQDKKGKQATGSTAKKKAQAWRRISQEHEVWVDLKSKQVMIGGKVCFREGQLEMFACPKQTKEHESVVSINAPSQLVHAGLLAVGALPGKPVQFDPKYEPAKGTVVDIDVVWTGKDGKQHRTRAQDWIRHLKTGKSMPYSWVFAGSGFWSDPTTGEKFYYADGGELICVSNFPTAMLDLPVKSSQENQDLQFAAFTERIPPLGTQVRLVLKPQLKKKADAEKKVGS